MNRDPLDRIYLILLKWGKLIGLIASISCATKEDLPPPNILWVTIEDLSPHLGVYGDENAKTPNLDAFAAKSILFTNAFATAPVCSPSRSCLITGFYGSSLGTQHLRSNVKIPDSITPYPKYLRKAGYYTTNNFKEDYNFIDTTIWDNSSNKAHWRERNGDQPFFSIFNLMLTHQSSIFGDDSVYNNRIKEFLPFITLSSADDLTLPPYYPDTPEIRKLWARYYTNISIVDYQFGKYLRELEDDGLMENTIVFFYSDHGTGVPRHKRALYDSGMKIPLMVHIPEKYAKKFNFKKGITNDNMISFIDFVPTLFELTGIESKGHYPGKAFIGKKEIEETHHVYGASDRVDEGYDLARSIRTKEYLYIRNFLPHLPLLQPNWYTDNSEIMKELNRVRHEDNLSLAQKEMFTSHRSLEELYDVEKDPHQLQNLANDPGYQDILQNLRNVLNDEVLKNFDTGFAPEPELIRLSEESTPFEFARKTDLYPLDKILRVCNIVLEDNILEDDLVRYLGDANGLVRYWAVIAAGSLEKFDATLITALQALLKDEYPTVQIEAARLLAEQNDDNTIEVVTGHMKSGDPALVLYASRTFQKMAKDREVLPKESRALYEKLKNEPPRGSD
ncbi:sulfatase-like hydrolase/transferase, partial [Aquiflexum sp.]|uniref:sulfatase-like hydrolase/transferase n=1 Tax=Aquiflexum sp. TaxID=1872584 RepID=UPI00359485DD